jgi:hypothetical protein
MDEYAEWEDEWLRSTARITHVNTDSDLRFEWPSKDEEKPSTLTRIYGVDKYGEVDFLK